LEFDTGVLRTATVSISNTAGVAFDYNGVLYIGITMAAVSQVSFHLEPGESKDISFPIIMPTIVGTYPVYLDVYSGGLLVTHYKATEDVVITISLPVEGEPQLVSADLELIPGTFGGFTLSIDTEVSLPTWAYAYWKIIFKINGVDYEFKFISAELARELAGIADNYYSLAQQAAVINDRLSVMGSFYYGIDIYGNQLEPGFVISGYEQYLDQGMADAGVVGWSALTLEGQIAFDAEYVEMQSDLDDLSVEIAKVQKAVSLIQLGTYTTLDSSGNTSIRRYFSFLSIPSGSYPVVVTGEWRSAAWDDNANLVLSSGAEFGLGTIPALEVS